jgi:toxin-antitoxin system PIN domain toxin
MAGPSAAGGSLIDSNVWLALSFEAHPAHAQVRALLQAATAERPWLWCRATQQSYLRLASTPAIQRAYGVAGVTNRDALVALNAWMALPQVALVGEPSQLMGYWARFGALDQSSPRRWMDAYLAAFAISGGWELISLDRDFLIFREQGLQLQLLEG